MRMYDEENTQDVNEAAEGGVNALMLATSTNSLSTVEALIALNADVNAATTDCKTTALMVACMSDYSDVAEALISAHADVNAVDKESFSPLMLAAAMGADRTIALLLRSDPPANQKWVQYDKSAKVGQNQSGRTALHWASAMGFLEACRLLVADPPTNEEKAVILRWKEKKRAATPLALAANQGHTDVVALLSEASLRVDDKDSLPLVEEPLDKKNANRTALHLAAQSGHPSCVRSLVIDARAKVDAKDSKGYSSLMLAAAMGEADVVRVLVQLGSTVDLPMENKLEEKEKEWADGTTALMLACACGHTSAVTVLLEARADVDARDRGKGKTSLHLACERGQHAVLRALLQAGAITDETDDDGRAALHAACDAGDLEACKALLPALKKGAAFNEPTSKGETPLMLAVKKKAPVELIKLLIGANADLDMEGPFWGLHAGVTPLTVAREGYGDADGYDGADIEKILATPRAAMLQ